MLLERVFLIGGGLVLALGVLWAVGGVIVARATGDFTFLIGGVLLFGFGGFFVHVGREARRNRERMLAEALQVR